MNICIVTPTFYPTIGGAEIMIYEIASRLAQKGHEITIITRRLGEMKKIENYNNLMVHRAFTLNNPFGIIPLQFSLFHKLGPIMKKSDILHQFYPYHMGLATILRKKVKKKPMVLTLVGYDTYDPIVPIPRIFYPYLSWVMNNSDEVTAICGELIGHAKIQGNKKKIAVIPAGVDVNKFNPDVEGDEIRKSLGIEDDEIMVLSVQRLHPRKKLQYLIKTAKIVTKTHPHVKFIVVGEGPERENLMLTRKEYNLEDNLILTGMITDVQLPQYYAACDIFALHSLYEGFGIVLVEAMATGKPVVTTEVGAIPEVVEHGKTGILVPPLNERAMADGISRLVVDKKLREEMGKNGITRAHKKYNWERIVDEYLKIYNKIAN